MQTPTVTKWVPTTNLMMLRRMGKFGEELGEELGELSAVTNRCIIQGIDEVDPSSGKTNRQRLIEEIADVMAQCEVTIEKLGLPLDAINERVAHKRLSMQMWEEMFEEGADAAAK